MLERIPNDRFIISNIIRLLEELGVAYFDDVIQNHIKLHFDSSDNEDYILDNYLMDFNRIPLPKLLQHATTNSDKEISTEAKRLIKQRENNTS